MVKVRLPEIRRAREELQRRADELRRAMEELQRRGQELRKMQEGLGKRVKVKEEFVSFRKEFQKNIVIFITGAFTFVAALTWNDLIKETISYFVSPTSELFYRYLAALVVTFVAIIIIYILSKFKSKD